MSKRNKLQLPYDDLIAEHREKLQKEQKPMEVSDDELQKYQDELYDFKVFAAKQAKEQHISFVHDFEWNNFCAELFSYFNERQSSVESIPDSVKFDEGFKTGREVGFREGVASVKPAECLKPEKDCWYVCIKDFYGGGKKQSSNGDLVQAKAGMYMMGREDISEWFRKAYYDEIKPIE